MNQDIHSHLEKLKVELSKLEPAIKHLQNADENATALITSLTNVHKEFSKHLQGVENSLSAANEKHQKQLTQEIREAVKKITDITEQLSKSNSAFEKQVKVVLSTYSELSESASRLIKRIEIVDFPSQFFKLESALSSRNQELEKTQQRFGVFERNIKDDLIEKQKQLIAKIETTNNMTDQRINDSEKESIARIETAENIISQRIDHSEKEFEKMFEKISKENTFMKILLFLLIGLAVGLIIYRIISGK